MKPAPFDYVRARTLDEALGWLAEPALDARILAGGQSLVPMMNMRLVRPGRLVDINALPLDAVRPGPAGGLVVGALIRHADLATAPLVHERAPLLAEAAAHIGHPAIRHRGTAGGSLAHADPAAELPAGALALDATLVAAGHGGRRRIPAEGFFVGPLTTALEPTEVLVEVEVPDHRGAGWGFAEVARRPGDFAIAGVAAVLRGRGDHCTSARLVAFGVGDRPLRLPAAESVLAGERAAPDLVRAAAEAARAGCRPTADVHASAEYRRHLVGVLVEQAVRAAFTRLAAAGKEEGPCCR